MPFRFLAPADDTQLFRLRDPERGMTFLVNQHLRNITPTDGAEIPNPIYLATLEPGALVYWTALISSPYHDTLNFAQIVNISCEITGMNLLADVSETEADPLGRKNLLLSADVSRLTNDKQHLLFLPTLQFFLRALDYAQQQLTTTSILEIPERAPILHRISAYACITATERAQTEITEEYRGAYGIVFKGFYVISADKKIIPIAIKKMLTEKSTLSKINTLTIKELLGNAALERTPRGYFNLAGERYIYMPFFETYDLHTWITNPRSEYRIASLTFLNLIKFLQQLLVELIKLRQRKFLMIDLKPENIRLQINDENKENPITANWIDFGLIRIVGEDHSSGTPEFFHDEEVTALARKTHAITAAESYDVFRFGLIVGDLLSVNSTYSAFIRPEFRRLERAKKPVLRFTFPDRRAMISERLPLLNFTARILGLLPDSSLLTFRAAYEALQALESGTYYRRLLVETSPARTLPTREVIEDEPSIDEYHLPRVLTPRHPHPATLSRATGFFPSPGRDSAAKELRTERATLTSNYAGRHMEFEDSYYAINHNQPPARSPSSSRKKCCGCVIS